MNRFTNVDKYKLPMHVAAALATGRTQLLQMGPVQLDEAAQKEILKLVVDLIEDRQQMDEKLALMGQIINEAARTIFGHARKLETAMLVLTSPSTRDEMASAVKRQEIE